MSSKLAIPLPYLRKMRAEDTGLLDTNINTWLRRLEDRRFLVRCFSDGPDGVGVARAVLSTNYKIIDHTDVLFAVLRGIKESGMAVTATADLTERRMTVRVQSEEIRALAPALLRRYRSPFSDATGADDPTVFAGFVFTNGETGASRWTVTPRIVVRVCSNGMTMNEDMIGAVHLGAELADTGVIAWSEDTRAANLTLIVKQARDAVRSFLDVDYVTRKLTEIERKAGREISDPQAAIQVVSQRLRFTADEQREILNHFIAGGDRTAGGVMHAVTSTAQTLTDPDAAFAMEMQGVRAMEIAATA